MTSGEMVQLSRLVEGLPVAWAGDPQVGESLDISGISYDSRRVESGDLFVAWTGEEFDGMRFAADAAGRGAVAVLGESCEDARVPCLRAKEPRRLLGPLASRLYGHPDRELLFVGVTGTNGKTTVVSLIAALLEAAGRPAASFGTLGYSFGELDFAGYAAFPERRTTPEASDLFRMLRGAQDAGARAAVMEVSSHALSQGRVGCATYDLAVFLNLTRDHLDFHGDLEHYFEAKAALFQQLKQDGRGVINVDDEWGRRLAQLQPRALTFGDSGDVRYSRLELSAQGISGTLESPAGPIELASPLLGEYNARNLLAAAAAGVAAGLDAAQIGSGLATLDPLPGRMQAVDCGQPFPVFVDFAHTDGALRAALASMRSLGVQRVAVVVGCGGERDAGKRQLMGAVAAELADYAILTSDNPRREDPETILEQMEEGARDVPGARYEVIVDRRDAIRRAIAIARPGWSVLIAGKGHERWQDLGDRRVEFVDADEVEKALEAGFGSVPIE
ncbi:MAG: UDP-N-acetylmuramoyl-L-alanyl-D-glutamate--2,6-diaminopimelate ligase [Acidobacteriota bacterium]|nr:UDP-N-acetylmuramoyl-L-alanyl-D-glutamate--2,6-diaminopimelate ligase [Acidobacteriota bacterium]